MKITYKILLFSLILTHFSCENGKGVLGEAATYDQTEFLKNISEEIILPSLSQLKDALDELKNEVDQLVIQPQEAQLEATRVALFQARLAWQAVQPFAFGPMLTHNLQGTFSIYPADVQQIERNIVEGTYDLNAISNLDAKGFQALGYLLYESAEAETSNLMIEEPRQDYLVAIVQQMQENTHAALTEWQEIVSTGIFSSVAAQGTDAGSSVAMLVNAINQNLERNLRDGKLAIPLGVRSLGIPIPEAGEAYFAGYSKELLLAAMQVYRNLYEGVTNAGINGAGLYEYLEAIKAEDTAGENLADLIRAQILEIEAGIESLEGDLEALAESNPSELEQIFVQMQRLVVYFKTDMASAMGVIIVYQDNDGD